MSQWHREEDGIRAGALGHGGRSADGGASGDGSVAAAGSDPAVGGGPVGYLVPASPCRAEQTIRRSRFIAAVGRADDPEAAARFVQGVRDGAPDATHHCWAYIAGPPGSTASVGMSDDREPHGSAGRPMLAVLLHSGIGNVVAVVTRYYGGTNLGVGGLVRAYSSTLQLALESLEVAERIDRVVVVVEVEYAALTALRRLVAAHDAEVLDESFGERIVCRVHVAAAHADEFARAVRDLTAGRARVSTLGRV